MLNQYRTAIVTGASRGIGVYIAQALAKEGMNLVLVARTTDDLNRVAAEISASGVRVIAVPTDLADKDALTNLVATAEAEFGAIDVLVNNAGFDNALHFEQETLENIENMIMINLISPMLLTRSVLPGMLQRQRGHIVNVTTLGAKIPLPYNVTYAAAKAGLAHFTTSLRAEIAGSGVSASVLLPGMFRDVGMAERVLGARGITKPSSVPTSPPEAAGKAVVQAIKHNLAEVAVPAPALLFARIPQLGQLFFKYSRITEMLRSLAEVGGSQ